MQHVPLKPLRYTKSDALCPDACRDHLDVAVDEVLGDDPRLGPGRRYVVRGRFASRDPSVRTLCLSCHGRSDGQPAVVRVGEGSFEVTARVLEVAPGRETQLDLLAFGEGGRELGVRLRIELEPAGCG